MKKSLYISAMLFAALAATSAMVSAKPAEDKIVAAYPADSIMLDNVTLIRVETVGSLANNRGGRTKVYIRKADVPDAILDAASEP